MADDAPAPILYVTDLGFAIENPADLFDLAFLLRSAEHDLRGVCLTEEGGDGGRVLDALTVRADRDVPCHRGATGLREALADAPEPLNLIVVAGYAAVAEVLEREPELFRTRVARLFLVGGFVNDYAAPEPLRLPINPRLREGAPERFRGPIDSRAAPEAPAFGKLLTSGEGVIWLPRDISLWRYAAPGMLTDGGRVAEFLLRELFFTHLRADGADADRYDLAERPVLLSAPPAFLLARRPDPFAWMRLFRTVAAHVTVAENGVVRSFATRTETPNLYAVVAIDGQGLSRLVTAGLRDRPLIAGE